MTALKPYLKPHMASVCKTILQEGFRLFLSENNDHGCFTDPEGSKVISFECPLGVFNWGGNYHPTPGNGTGWVLEGHGTLPDAILRYYEASPPHWCRGCGPYTTLSEHLSRCWASGYHEILSVEEVDAIFA